MSDNNKDLKCSVVSYTDNGSPLYYPIKYKWSEEDKCMVPYFDKPLNRYEMIQASKDSTDIHAIINRVKVGDVSVLNVYQGTDDVDISEIPDNINDAVALQSKALKNFNDLPAGVRAVFNNDVNEFMDAVLSGNYLDKINQAKDNQAKDNQVKDNQAKDNQAKDNQAKESV